MKIAVIGGKLQGVEALYLARQVGWETVLVDKTDNLPASSICDRFYQLDVTKDSDQLKRILKSVDLIVPALENKSALRCLRSDAMKIGVPMAFDEGSYAISSSKLESDKLFRENEIPAPNYWPEVSMPVILKPSAASGSKGVVRIETEQELAVFAKGQSNFADWVVQEYLTGPSYSLEVMGLNGTVVSYQVTELEMDRDFDCKRVIAPAMLDHKLEEDFRAIAARIAKLIKLTGIMDVEVIEHQGRLRVLEIDARIPSQTPTVVWQSTGINMLEHLVDVYVSGRLPKVAGNVTPKGVVYEHIKVSPDKLEILGEHVMSDAGPLSLIKGFWGADEALTNYQPGFQVWVATLIFIGSTRTEAWTKRNETVKSIQKTLRLQYYIDSAPRLVPARKN